MELPDAFRETAGASQPFPLRNGKSLETLVFVAFSFEKC